MINSCPGCKFV